MVLVCFLTDFGRCALAHTISNSTHARAHFSFNPTRKISEQLRQLQMLKATVVGVLKIKTLFK